MSASSAPAPEPKLRLIYFDIPGKGEPIRLLCAFLGIELDDDRVGSANTGATDDQDVFLRSVSEGRWAQLKATGLAPFGQLPLLLAPKSGASNSTDLRLGKNVDVIAQCAAIMRFIGRQPAGVERGVYPPNDAVLQARIDSLMDQEADAFAGVRVARYHARFGMPDMTETEQATVYQHQIDDVLPRHCGFLEKMLGESATGWLCGTPGPTVADFVWATTLKPVKEGTWPTPAFKAILEGFPRLSALVDKLYALEEIRMYFGNDEQ
jgi:glutathione S-transferase